MQEKLNGCFPLEGGSDSQQQKSMRGEGDNRKRSTGGNRKGGDWKIGMIISPFPLPFSFSEP